MSRPSLSLDEYYRLPIECVIWRADATIYPPVFIHHTRPDDPVVFEDKRRRKRLIVRMKELTLALIGEDDDSISYTT